MKKITLILFMAATMFSCSDDDTASRSTNETSVTGKWALKREWINGVANTLNECRYYERFTFTNSTFTNLYDDDNGTGDPNDCDLSTVIGDYTRSQDVLTLKYNDGENITLPMKIIELTDTKMVVETDESITLKQEYSRVEE